MKIMRKFFHKDGNYHTEFEEKVKEINSRSSTAEIEDCAQSYNESFASYKPDELIQCPIKMEAEQFIVYLVPKATKILSTNNKNPIIFHCLSSISYFLPTQKDISNELYQLTIRIFSSNDRSVLIEADSILQNFTLDKRYAEQMIKSNFLEVYGVGKSCGPPVSNLSFKLLINCIMRTKQVPDKAVVEIVKTNFGIESSEHLSLIAAIFKISAIKPDFDKFNKQIKVVNDCSCYEYLLSSFPEAKAYFVELCQNPSDKLGPSLLSFFTGHSDLPLKVENFTKYFGQIDPQKQAILFAIIKRKPDDLKELIILDMLPPWKYRIDGNVFLKFLTQNCKLEKLSQILEVTLTNPDKEVLKLSFTTVPNFTKLIIGLFLKIVDTDDFPKNFGHFLEIVYEGSNDPIHCFIDLCSKIETAKFKDLLIPNFSRLLQIQNFVDQLPKFLKIEYMAHHLLCKEVIEPAVMKGLADFLALLAKDGPHEEIDRIILRVFRESDLKNLSQLQLTKLSRAVPQDSADSISGSIKIPSLIPFITQVHLTTLSDRYVAGKYLIDHGLIDQYSSDSRILSMIGVQYLTIEIASSLIENPRVLFEVTDPTFPHQSVYQFEINSPESYILAVDLNFTFYFRIDNYDRPFVLLEVVKPVITYNQNTIFIGEKGFPCELRKWHKVVIILSPSGLIDITLDSKIKMNVQQIGPAVIGSRSELPGSTFYIQSPLAFRTQIGTGVLSVDYRGFSHFAPLINAVPRIFKAMIDVKNKENFSLYFNTLLNLHLYDSNKNNSNSSGGKIANFVGFLRQILIIKSEFVTDDMIQAFLSLISRNGKIDWNLFKIAFIDYNLWSKLSDALIPVCVFLQNYFKIDPPDQSVIMSLSLFHFFVDLNLFVGVGNDFISQTLMILRKFQEDTMSSYVIHFLNKNPPPIVQHLIGADKSLLDLIPLEFLRYTTQEFSLIYLKQYSRRCFTSDDAFNYDRLFNLLSFFKTMVKVEELWIHILAIMCKSLLPDLSSFRSSTIERKNMLGIIFPLICEYYQVDPKNIILEQITDIVESLITRCNIFLLPFIDVLREVSHFGVTIDHKVKDPIHFGNSFEPCRMPIDSSRNQMPITENPTYASEYQCKKSIIFMNGKDLWFGQKSEMFSEACDEELKSISYHSLSPSDMNNNGNTNGGKSREKLENTSSAILKIVNRIVTQCLLQLKGEQLSTGLRNLLIFGSNIDATFTLKYHQMAIFSLLSMSPPHPETLIFLKMMVIAGWWDDQLYELFRALCTSGQRLDQTNSPSWKHLGELFKCILALVTDYSRIPFSSFQYVIFSPQIIETESNMMFYFHIFLSEPFLGMPPIRSRDAWLSFLLQMQAIKNPNVFNCLTDGNNNNNSVSYDGIIQQITDVANSTSYFTDVPLSQMRFVNQLKEKAKPHYDNFVREQSKQMEDIYRNIANIRESLVERMEISNEAYSQRIFDVGVRKIEKFCFEVRFNFLSTRDENDAHQLWAFLPPAPPLKFQVAPSVHPTSVPTLLIPFLTDVVDFSKYQAYGVRRNKKENVGPIKLLLSEIPHCIDTFVAQPFFGANNKVVTQIFQMRFIQYGKLIDIDQISLIVGTNMIRSAFVTNERGFFIVVDAKIDSDKNISLVPQSTSLATNTFLDNCACNYFGECSLFFGHIVLSFSTHDILINASRDFLFKATAIEIWFARGYSLYLRFSTSQDAYRVSKKIDSSTFIPSFGSCYSLSFSKKLCKSAQQQTSKAKQIQVYQTEWVNNQMSTYAYLMILNFFANRSFSCVSQYPVFPWVLPNRDLAKPMGQQTQERAIRFATKFGELEDKYFYTQFYSSQLIVLRFLMRLQPFTNYFLEFNKAFENPDRTFNCIEDDWALASKLSDSNVEELIPEIYILPEMFININNVPFPKSSRHSRASNASNTTNATNTTNTTSVETDFVLPPNVTNFPMLTSKLRIDLNKTDKMEKWIDLIFGYKSSGNDAALALNVFQPSTYGRMPTFIEKEADLEEHMLTLGILPTPLFDKEHPSRDTINHWEVPILTYEDQIIGRQLIKTPNMKGNEDDLLTDDGKLVFISVLKTFNDVFDKKKISLNDGIFNWPIDSGFEMIRFSVDKTLLVGIVGCGSLQVYRVISDKKTKSFSSFELLSTCFLPQEYIDAYAHLHFTSCFVSSHLNLVCESCGSTVFCFHVSSSRFIRTIEFDNILKDVLISDSFEMIFGIGEKSIEVFTINGTKVASCNTSVESNNSDEIITAASLSINDNEVFIATGHNNGKIRLWNVDLEHGKLINNVKIDDFSDSCVKFIKIFKKGAAMIALDMKGKTELFATAPIGESIMEEKSAACCAECKKTGFLGRLSECHHCKLYFCRECSHVSNSQSICSRCMERVIVSSSVDF